MLVLGRKYKFTELEKQRLKKKNLKTNVIKYRNKDPQEVLKEIKKTIKKEKIKIIVLNTKATVDNEIIKYLTNLQFEKNIKMISIERFMEDYLHKCYIPEDNTDLNYLSNIKPFSKWQYFQKRVIDYLGVFSLLILTWPVLLYARYKTITWHIYV